jgi:hypothetical protein
MEQKDANSPSGGDSEYKNERAANDVIGTGSFAPALEHTNESDSKEQNCQNGERLDEHEDTPVVKQDRAKREASQ